MDESAASAPGPATGPAPAYDLAGRRVLVTGASSGIGAGLAEAFAAAGATVGICARRADRLADTLARCRDLSPGSCSWVVDLADPAAVDRLAADAADALGGVDVLVNNAGIPLRRHVTRLDAATVEAVMAVNFLSPARLTLALLPAMVEQGHGRVVNVSSVAAVLSSPAEAAYSASKAALAVWSESLAVDLWDTGVHTMTVYPGVVDTELFTIPGNDPLLPGIDKIPVAEAVEAVLDGLRRGAVEVYVPAFFADLAAGKAANVAGFLTGTVEYVKAQRGT
ncbi:MAG TPA: SDR family NAD(P)-dependent oxidoreductase [Acidimicrobiales bacterium]|nr:SDR family NAD(P)-dependent oxidoreductase [Acidimicrobiales bacterium]